MRILVAGGGSGGHVTPALAILEELIKKQPDITIWFVCDRKFAPQAETLIQKSNLPITVKVIRAGKFRRYHGYGWWHHLDPRTLFPNIRDFLYFSIGTIQSFFILWRFRPDVIFTKGGFVCLPIGFATHILRKPLVIHDSDAHPGLTNRILSRWATTIATGAPLKNYNYPPSKSHYVGIPVSQDFQPLTDNQRQELKQKYVGSSNRPLVFVTGGGLGALPINEAIIAIAGTLIDNGIEIIHIAGKRHGETVKQQVGAQLSEEQQKYYHVYAFIDSKMMQKYIGAADVVVSRAGATTAAELANMHKATIFIPNAMLTGGHQVKNATAFGDAAVVLDEQMIARHPNELRTKIEQIVTHPVTRQRLEEAIGKFAKMQAAKEMAGLILTAAKREET